MDVKLLYMVSNPRIPINWSVGFPQDFRVPRLPMKFKKETPQRLLDNHPKGRVKMRTHIFSVGLLSIPVALADC